ncbi:glycosyltransferase family 2 protein [Hymenobacter taeanensis]|uniref:Glycosyltransferase family 2 protein n=1 Tax=Hymenobacter taeanensis TaxID=2735321 RepID=A0A6M6BHV7_9BACT|nr:MULTISPECIES: glycosyltransferase family A protein [Hymenobacter]QJX47562.1 glycosyltransferase family 2 protein [Hymenobacter taeanensis]UOQ82954.1 glycosyltransferase family 2 protein [Hymenobacter sp. 5414T-23]
MKEICFFSVVIPSYNRESFIRATVESVVSQTYSDFEILIVDDGSTDKTADIVAPFLIDTRIKYFPKCNAERGAARNYGMARARGEYVLFLDSDDRWLPDHLATLYQAIQEQKQPNFIACKFQLERDGQLTPSDLASRPAGYYGLDIFLHGNPLACNFAVRRENPQLILFEEDRKYASVEDWMFMLQNMEHDHLYLVDAATVIMNDHDDRSMRADHRTMSDRWLKLPSWFDEHLHLTQVQRQQLLGHIYYLCAIHAYAADARNEALLYAWKALPALSVRQAAVLVARCMIGVGGVGLLKKFAKRS